MYKTAMYAQNLNAFKMNKDVHEEIKKIAIIINNYGNLALIC